nr:hypothetical protein [Tanacetum cinerariifolium]
MASFDYRLNPLFSIKECSSCEALYTTNSCCSEGILEDKIISDLDKIPNLSQRSPQNYPKCGNPVDGHYCQGCALLRKKFKEDLFTSCVENGILQDSSEPSNDNTNVVNALREPFVINQDPEDIFCHQCTSELCGNGAHCGYNYPSKVLIVPNPEPFNNQTIKELPPTVPSFDSSCYSKDTNSFTYDSTSNLVHDSPNVFDPTSQLPFYSYEFCGNDAYYGHYLHPEFRLSIRNRVTIKTLISRKIFMIFNNKIFVVKIVGLLMKLTNEEEKQTEEEQVANARYWKIPACYDDDDDDYTFAITPNEPDNSLIFTTFSNILFDADYDFYFSDDQSFSDEDTLKKIYSNPLFDEEIISMKIDPHHFNAESDLIESLLNHDSSIISSSSKIDSLFDELAGELTLLKSIPLGINETDCDPEEETLFINRLLYDNSSPRLPKELIFENSDAVIEFFSPSPIPVEDSDSLIEEIDLSFTPDDPMPPGIEEDDYDSERNILILE